VLRVEPFVPRLIEGDLRHEPAEVEEPLFDALQALVGLVEAGWSGRAEC
jgi:hypothetical protein